MQIKQYPAHSSNYSGPSRRLPIDLLVVHHMAGRLTADQCGKYFAGQGRGASAHYGIGLNGEVDQYVPDNCVAWHAGNSSVNRRSIGIECSNSATGGNWPISEATINSLVELLAMKAREYKLGRLVVGRNLGYHSMYSRTECPGEYMRSKTQEICDRVNAINYPPTPTPQVTDKNAELNYEKISPKCVRLIRDTSLWNFNFTKWGDAKAIKPYAANETVEVVAIAHNKTMNASYYMTAHSYNEGNIRATNGFNIKDCVDLASIVSKPAQETPTEPEAQTPTSETPKPQENAPAAPYNASSAPSSNLSASQTPETNTEEQPAPSQEEETTEGNATPAEAETNYAKENHTLLKKILELLEWLAKKITGIFK